MSQQLSTTQQLSLDDYTQPVEQVIKRERNNSPEAVHERFVFWARSNPLAVVEMYYHAKRLVERQLRRGQKPCIAVQYLFEWLRYDSRIALDSVEEYKLPNEFAPVFARYLVAHDSTLAPYIELRKSRFDEMQLRDIGWMA